MFAGRALRGGGDASAPPSRTAGTAVPRTLILNRCAQRPRSSPAEPFRDSPGDHRMRRGCRVNAIPEQVFVRLVTRKRLLTRAQARRSDVRLSIRGRVLGGRSVASSSAQFAQQRMVPICGTRTAIGATTSPRRSPRSIAPGGRCAAPRWRCATSAPPRVRRGSARSASCGCGCSRANSAGARSIRRRSSG